MDVTATARSLEFLVWTIAEAVEVLVVGARFASVFAMILSLGPAVMHGEDRFIW